MKIRLYKGGINMNKLSKTTFKMPIDLKNQVKLLAKQKNKTMSALILEMIYESYESRKKGV